VADADIRITADTQQAKQEIRELGEEAERAKGQVEELGNAGESTGGKIDAGLVLKVGAAIATFKAAYDVTRDLIDSLKEYGINIDEVVQKLLGFGDAEEFVITQSEKAARAHYEQARAVELMQEKIFGSVRALKQQTQVTIDAIRAQLEHGEVTEEETETARKAVQKLLDAYLKAGEQVPQALAAIAAELGVMSSAQEKAAAAAEKEAAALEKQAAKAAAAAAATKPLVEAKREQSEVSEIAARFLELENEKLEENARLAVEAAEAARQKFEADQERIAELQGKPVLDVGELNELSDLTSGQAKGYFEYGEAAQEADAAQIALNESQQEQIDLGGDLNQILESTNQLTREQAEALGDIGNVDLGGAYREASREIDNFSNSQGEVINQAERFGAVWQYTNEQGQEVITNFDAELGRLEDGLGDAENAAGGFADAVKDIGREGGQIGDQIARGAEKATTEVDKMLEGQKTYNEELETSVALARQLVQALREAAEAV